MTETVFPYSGGKSYLAQWIIPHFPEHEVYVEPFGGSGSVLLNKKPSYVEVYNDIDSEVVNFFEVYRDHTDELVEWLESTPYSRELHDRYSRQYFDGGDGELPDDDLVRAGIFFYLRYTQFMGKNGGKSGFQSTTSRNNAGTFRHATDRLKRLVDRFSDVVIENRDYQRIFEHYDTDETLFYCDPPYLEKGTDWYEGEFDHEEFWSALDGLDGDWIVSYMAIPDYVPIEDYYVVEKSFSQRQDGAHDKGEPDTRDERLIMNYDPDQIRGYKPADHEAALDW